MLNAQVLIDENVLSTGHPTTRARRTYATRALCGFDGSTVLRLPAQVIGKPSLSLTALSVLSISISTTKRNCFRARKTSRKLVALGVGQFRFLRHLHGRGFGLRLGEHSCHVSQSWTAFFARFSTAATRLSLLPHDSFIHFLRSKIAHSFSV